MRGFGRRERARVAERVRALLAESRPDATDEPDDWGAVRYHESGPLRWTADDTDDDANVDDPLSPSPDGSTARVGGAHAAEPRRVRRWRFDPGRPAALAIVVAAVLAAVVAGWWVLAGKPHAVALDGPSGVPVDATSGSASSASPSTGCAAASSTASAVLVVDVAGKVVHPGVYRLRSGSRVVDAIQAAGGALPGVSLASLNLAAPLVDGAQIAVGVPPAAGVPVGSGAPASGGGSGAAGALVNINTATLEQLETLPGIGPVLGQQILDWRTQHGGFSSVDQLKEVSGIGDTRFAELQPLVTI